MARNTSDSIEEYIKELLGQSGIAEIQRSNLADTFQVVPSQINLSLIHISEPTRP